MAGTGRLLSLVPLAHCLHKGHTYAAAPLSYSPKGRPLLLLPLLFLPVLPFNPFGVGIESLRQSRWMHMGMARHGMGFHVCRTLGGSTYLSRAIWPSTDYPNRPHCAAEPWTRHDKAGGVWVCLVTSPFQHVLSSRQEQDTLP